MRTFFVGRTGWVFPSLHPGGFAWGVETFNGAVQISPAWKPATPGNWGPQNEELKPVLEVKVRANTTSMGIEREHHLRESY